MNKRKKGQISVELLLILSIFVIGGIVFGTYYLSAIKPKTTPTLELNDNIFKDKINTIEQTGNLGEITIVPPEDPPISQFSNLVLSLIPNSSSHINSSFGIKASVLEVTGYTSGKIKKVEVKKKDTIFDTWDDSSDCSFNGSYNSVFNDLNFLYLNDPSLENTVNFSCNSEGTYEFTFYVSPEPNSENITLIKPIEKIIISPGGCSNFTGNIVFDQIGGTYNAPIDLKLNYINDINCTGAIRYTTDGTEPYKESEIYSAPINLTQNLTSLANTIIKAKVFGKNSSNVDINTDTNTQTYILKVETPKGTPVADTYSTPQTIFLSTTTPDAIIRYTENGSEPKTTSTEYKNPFIITETKTIKAKAFKSNWVTSDTLILVYTINLGCISYAGTGRVDDPYIICTAKDLYDMSGRIRDSYLNSGEYKHFKLGQDIDLSHTSLSFNPWYDSQTGWTAIGFWTDSAEGYTDLDSYKFIGSFDGNGHTISNLYVNVNSEYYADPWSIESSRHAAKKGGLFGPIGVNSTIKNLNLVNPKIFLKGGSNESIGAIAKGMSGNGSSIENCNVQNAVLENNLGEIGGFVSYLSNNNSKIKNSLFFGEINSDGNNCGCIAANLIDGNIENTGANCVISGGNNIGGLVGTNLRGAIKQSSAIGRVLGNDNVGGLVGSQINSAMGSNKSRIINSYSHSNVNGNNNIGGLVGHNTSGIQTNIPTVLNSYSKGSVSGAGGNIGGLVGNGYTEQVTSSYWDTVTSGQSSSAGGTGYSTNRMKEQARYVGWDFTNIWDISNLLNEGYPYLRN